VVVKVDEADNLLALIAWVEPVLIALGHSYQKRKTCAGDVTDSHSNLSHIAFVELGREDSVPNVKVVDFL